MDSDKDVFFLEKRNFSGRSDFLRHWANVFVDAPEQEFQPAIHAAQNPIYIGPQTDFSLSGLSASVEHELRLHMGRENIDENNEQFNHLVDSLDLGHLLAQSPWSCSGGEISKIALACAILKRPDGLALDGALEQLDKDTRAKLISLLYENMTAKSVTLIADNRDDDINPNTSKTLIPAKKRPAKKSEYVPDICADMFPSTKIEAPTLAFENVSFRHKGNKTNTLENISLALQPAQIYFLKGRNGAGKSTLAQLLCGVHKPQRGRLYLNDAPFEPWKYGNSEISYHFQNPYRQMTSTTISEAFLQQAKATYESAFAPAKYAREWSGAAWGSICAAFGLTEYLEHELGGLPFTLLKRAFLATTIGSGRSWLIFDEPNVSQDPINRLAIRQILEALNAMGFGIIVISHFEDIDIGCKSCELFLENGYVHMGRGEP